MQFWFNLALGTTNRKVYSALPRNGTCHMSRCRTERPLCISIYLAEPLRLFTTSYEAVRHLAVKREPFSDSRAPSAFLIVFKTPGLKAVNISYLRRDYVFFLYALATISKRQSRPRHSLRWSRNADLANKCFEFPEAFIPFSRFSAQRLNLRITPDPADPRSLWLKT